jgi:hypothetical protein
MLFGQLWVDIGQGFMQNKFILFYNEFSSLILSVMYITMTTSVV